MRRYLILTIALAASASLPAPSTDAAVKKAPPTTAQTYTVLVGWENPHEGIGINAYLPETVTWEMSPTNMAPHTVTFLNGNAEPGLAIPVPQSSGPPVPYANPATFFPS
jgi:hypothetical protein